MLKEELIVQEHSLFVTQIEEAMRSLIGVIDNAEVKTYGLQVASAIYDRLLNDWQASNGIPDPSSMTKEQAVAEAFVLACKHLNLIATPPGKGSVRQFGRSRNNKISEHNNTQVDATQPH